uniref:Bm9813 n=1 Tax=Brugia malayi TaxID=6279 RepID=A0A0J9XUL3_BRUMA|nr:Bm9813 [Brugia malayi]
MADKLQPGQEVNWSDGKDTSPPALPAAKDEKLSRGKQLFIEEENIILAYKQRDSEMAKEYEHFTFPALSPCIATLKTREDVSIPSQSTRHPSDFPS